jgi:hypothetical protein
MINFVIEDELQLLVLEAVVLREDAVVSRALRAV